MEVDNFEKVVENWSNHLLVDGLQGYKLQIDDDVPKEFAAIALFLDSKTVRAAGERKDYYEGFKNAAVEVLSFVRVELAQDDENQIIRVMRTAPQGDKEERLKEFIWG